ILRGDAFSEDLLSRVFDGAGFDWILGNPPWKELRPDRKEDEIALRWATDHRKEHPIGAGLVRCHLLPVCYVAPAELRELRRLLRYRNLVVAQAVRMK